MMPSSSNSQDAHALSGLAHAHATRLAACNIAAALGAG
jgi:hypothetical protein